MSEQVTTVPRAQISIVPSAISGTLLRINVTPEMAKVYDIVTNKVLQTTVDAYLVALYTELPGPPSLAHLMVEIIPGKLWASASPDLRQQAADSAGEVSQ